MSSQSYMTGDGGEKLIYELSFLSAELNPDSRRWYCLVQGQTENFLFNFAYLASKCEFKALISRYGKQ